MSIRKAIKNKLSDDIASHENHCMDNTFIRVELDVTEANMHYFGYQPIGICNPPFTSYGKRDYALVYENKDFYKQWCHITERILKHWLRQLN